MIAGLRYRLIHDYNGINSIHIVEVIFDDIDPCIHKINKILQSIEET